MAMIVTTFVVVTARRTVAVTGRTIVVNDIVDETTVEMTETEVVLVTYIGFVMVFVVRKLICAWPTETSAPSERR